MIFTFVLLLTILFLLFILSMVWPPDSPWAPWWRIPKSTAHAIAKLAEVSSRDCVYELGCGDAVALYAIVKKTHAYGVGIEIDPIRYFVALCIRKVLGLEKQVQLIRENFFYTNISDATVVVVYLVPSALNRLLPKFKKELKKGTKIMSYRYQVELSQVAYNKQHNIYMYKI